MLLFNLYCLSIFRDMVKAAHLKPLEKKDQIKEDIFVQPWNIAADIAKHDRTTSKDSEVNIKVSALTRETNCPLSFVTQLISKLVFNLAEHPTL